MKRPLAWRFVASGLKRRVPGKHLPPILGDLQEDYHVQLASHGRLRAEVWLIREGLSLWSAYRPKTTAKTNPARRFAPPPLNLLLRRLRHQPGFATTAIVTLALCLAANLTIFAVVDAVLLRPLPFPEPERLVSVFNTYPKADVPDDGCSLANYYERRGAIPALAGISVYRHGSAVLGQSGATEVVPITRVSPEFFATLGVGPTLGRAFTEKEMTYETDQVAIVADGYWRRHLAADPGVIGRNIRVDGFPRQVVGVLPPAFHVLSSKSEIYLPLSSNPESRIQRHSGSSDMIARLAAGISIAQAQTQIDVHNDRLEVDSSMADAGFRSIVKPLRAYHVGGTRSTLVLTQAAGFFLLLIGAANLTNLLLVRANGRARELAIRQAIGAGRGHVFGELLGETLALALLGGTLGLGLGAAGIRLVAVLGADQLPLAALIRVDARIALVGLSAAIALGVAIGAPVAWLPLRSRLTAALQSGSRGQTANRSALRMRHAFVAGQVGLAFVLLTSAGLLGVSLNNAMQVSPGFRPENVATGRILLPWNGYRDGAARVDFVERLQDRLRRQPGFVAAGVATNVPLSGNSDKSASKVEGHTLGPGESPKGRYSYGVGGDYFSAMDFELVEGRFLVGSDSRRQSRVCVVDEDFARDSWPTTSALGQRVFQGPVERTAEEAFTVVGVVAPAKQAGLTDDSDQGAIYYPFGYRHDGSIFVVARAALPADIFGATLRRVVREVDPELPITDLESMETRIADSLVMRRSPALLTGVFAALALLLTTVGTYGVLSYAVAERRREIGVRMALGASPAQVRVQFLRFGLRLLVMGAVLGLPGVWLGGQTMRAILFGVAPLDAAILLTTACVVGAATLIACLVPSHRAARTSPLAALSE